MLLSTKFHNPLSVGRLTERPRLDARMDEGISTCCPLVLVTAPAGFGKSTLVSAWLRRQRAPFSWLSLDRTDNDPGQFLEYLVGALQKIDPGLGASQLNRIQTAESADSEAVYADVMKDLVNEIAGEPTLFLLALDDCHVLKNQLVLQLLNFLVENQPVQLRLILLSREDLPLPISRMRVRRQVIEIRQADLQFSPEEAEDFLRVGMGITQLTSGEILALDKQTEGWIAGLQLAGLSIKSDPDPSHFIRSFTGSDRYILDYFMEEVFIRQPEEIQKFLLACSILERFCASLCDTVISELAENPAGVEYDSQAMLERLERSNLFLIPLDNQRHWYRYHHLFADLLRYALAKASPRKIPTLHLRASQWLEANGYIPEAVQHAFQTGDWIYAAELVERHAWNIIIHSQVGIVSEWCNRFPEDIIGKRPVLCIFHSWALIIGFKKDDFQAANIRLKQAETALADIDSETRMNLVVGVPPVRLHTWVTGQITLLRSFILMVIPRKEANAQSLIDIGLLAYEQLPLEDIPARSAALLDICYASQALSHAQEAEQKFENTIDIALGGNNFFGAMIGEYHRAHGRFVQGRLQEAIDFCRQKREAYEARFEHPLRELPAIALLDQVEGCALLEMNKLDQAETFLRSGLEVGQWMPREELPAYLALIRLYFLKGDPEGMQATFRRLEMRWPDIKYCTQALHTLYDLLSNPEDECAQRNATIWAEAHLPEIGPEIIIPGIGPAFNDEADHAIYVAWSKIQILLGKGEEALGVIQPMLQVAKENGIVHRVIELSLLEAEALFVQGQKELARTPLQQALSLAESHSYVCIVDRNPVLVRLLKDALKDGMSVDFIRRILDIDQSEVDHVSTLPVPAGSQRTGESILIEPLSSREKEVLALMAEGLSNIDIAARLFLSPNTLKAHTQNIFGKLDVHNRIRAVNKARELKII